MKVIFLDIDGVLNSMQQSVCENIVGTFNFEGLDRIGIGLIRKLCELTNAKIVISSTWRMGSSVDMIMGAFEAHGWRGASFHKIIIGATPVLNGTRGIEIEEWLACHPEVTNYIIVDDDADMLESQMDNFVHTDGVLGFTLYDMVKGMDILGVDSHPDKQKRADDLRETIEFKLNKRKNGCDYSI